MKLAVANYTSEVIIKVIPVTKMSVEFLIQVSSYYITLQWVTDLC